MKAYKGKIGQNHAWGGHDGGKGDPDWGQEGQPHEVEGSEAEVNIFYLKYEFEG